MSAPVVSCPTPIQPRRTNTPPTMRTEPSTMTWTALMTGKSTDRSQSVYRSQAVHCLIRRSERVTRRSPSRCASMVRPASTVSASAAATAAYPAASER